jgi:short-subunit dehydrogenase
MATHGKGTVFLTGASSGIGYALALELAARGYDLALTARRLDVLAQLRQRIVERDSHRQVEVRALDVTRYDEVGTAIREAAAKFGGLDIVIANAGIGSTGRIGHGHFDGDRAVIETNVIGAMATLDAATALFRALGRGHLVAISSVAAARGLPTSGAYSASKAAIAVYAEALRAELHGSGIAVTTLFPGYIDTPINQQMPSRPFLIDVESGARIVADLIERRVHRSTVPVFPWNLVWYLLKWLPTAILARAVK